MNKALKSSLVRQMKEALRAIKIHSEVMKQESQKETFRSERRSLAITKIEASDRYGQKLKTKVIESLKSYIERKRDEAVYGMMARKYNFLRRLKIVIRLLRKNIVNQKEYRRKIRESDYHYQRNLIARLFSFFKGEDKLGQAREKNLV